MTANRKQKTERPTMGHKTLHRKLKTATRFVILLAVETVTNALALLFVLTDDNPNALAAVDDL